MASTSNINNLAHLKFIENFVKILTHPLHFGLSNVRSIKNKAPDIFLCTIEYDSDIYGLCETWLSEVDRDKIWSKATELNNNGYRFLTINRKKKHGGGLALMVKENINCKKVVYAPRQTFEFRVWKITSKNFTVNFLLVYQPPLASTLNCFTDEFLVLLEEIIAQQQNIIILGDFSIHFNDDLDPYTIQFKDTMLALGLQQHVTESTHNLGNILDHVYSESLSKYTSIEHEMHGLYFQPQNYHWSHQSL